MIYNNKLLVSILMTLILILSIGFMFSFQGTSDSYSLDAKYDSFAQTDATSDSFSSRFIGGVKAVGNYIGGLFEGRFGILDDGIELTYEDLSSCGDLNVPYRIYTLTQDVNSSGNCFTISAENVTLNCGGHKINYSQSSQGYGVFVNGFNSSIVKNCEISQGSSNTNSHAIYLRNNGLSKIYNNTILTYGSSSYGIYLRSSSINNVSRNILSTYGLNAYSIYVHESSSLNNVIKSNELNIYGTASALFLNGVNNTLVQLNDMMVNGASPDGALRVTSGFVNNITSNNIRATSVGSVGMRLDSYSRFNEVRNNNIQSNSFALTLIYGANNKIYNNVLNTTGNNIASISDREKNVNYISNFNTTKTASMNIIGGGNIGGNYWEDGRGRGISQTCRDVDEDGICDSVYSITARTADFLPLAVVDNLPPNVSIISPMNNSFVNGIVVLRAEAIDDGEVVSVTFEYSNATTPWTTISGCVVTSPIDSTSYYDCNWNTALLSQSAYNVRAVASDGINTATDVKTYTIDRTKPIIYSMDVTYPQGQQSVRYGQNITLRTTVTDAPQVGAGIYLVSSNLENLNGSSWTNMTFVSGSLMSNLNSTWSVDLNILSSQTGTKTANILVLDKATPTKNNRTGDLWNVVVDNQPPTYSGIDSTSENYNNTLATFVVSVEDNFKLKDYIFSHNMGGVWVNDSLSFLNDFDLSGSVDYISHRMIVYSGTFNYKFYVFDDAGNMLETSSGEITVLGPAPTPNIYLVSPEHNLVSNSQSQNFNFSISNSNVDNCSLILNGFVNETLSLISPDFNYGFEKTLEDGAHSWSVSCLKVEEEGGQNVTNEYFSEIRFLEIDSVAPIVSIQNPLADTYLTSTLEVNVSTDEDVEFCVYSVNGGENVTMSRFNSTYYLSSISGLNNGDYTIVVSCKDFANNYGFDSVIFSVGFVSINIDLVSPLNNAVIPRGGVSYFEDVLGVVDDEVQILARVHDGSDGYLGANCYFYWNDSLIGDSYTNSTGYCNTSYDKSSLVLNIYPIFVNYTYLIQDVTRLSNFSQVNISLTKYTLPNDVAGTVTIGGLKKYYDGNTARLIFNVTKVNATGTFLYDPMNLTVNATNSQNQPYPESAYVSGYRLYRVSQGKYETWVNANASFGTYLRWKIWASDDDFESYIASALHTDVEVISEVCVPDCSCASNVCTGSTCSDGCGGVCAGAMNCASPGGPSVCTPRWGEWSAWSECINGQQTSYRNDGCGNVEFRFQACGPQVEICDDGIDNNGNGLIDCADSSCVNNPVCVVCVPDWSCSWSSCENDGTGIYYSHPYNCVDKNSCGVQSGLPNKRICEINEDGEYEVVLEEGEVQRTCIPSWDCGEWGECDAEYDMADVLKGNPTTSGVQMRICFDKSGCESNITEFRNCSLAVPIRAERTEWCFEEYVEIYEVDTNQLVSRIKEGSRFGLKRVDINFKISEVESYCPYCYDGIKNFDETDVDCGGSCPSCVDWRKYTDWFLYLRWLLWIILLMLLVYMAWANRQYYGEYYFAVKDKLGIGKKRIPETFVSSPGKTSLFMARIEQMFSRKPKTQKVITPTYIVKEPGIVERFVSGLKSELEERRYMREARAREKSRLRAVLVPSEARKEFKTQVKTAKKEARFLKRRIKKKAVSKKELADLRKKLAEWRRKGYYRTTGLLKKLDKYEKRY